MPNSSTNKDTKLEFAITEVNPLALFGTEDQLLKTIEAEHPTVSVLVRGNQVSITGSEAECLLPRNLSMSQSNLFKLD